MTIDSKEPFTIQAGKRYNHRNGEISGKLRYPEGERDCLTDGSRFYTLTGLSVGNGGRYSLDLISEYIEPTGYTEEDAKKEYRDYVKKIQGIPCAVRADPDAKAYHVKPTTEPQDEWGPWIGWGAGLGGGDVNLDQVKEVMYRNGSTVIDKHRWIDWTRVAAYRIKKEPGVQEMSVWIDELGELYLNRIAALDRQCSPEPRKAIITTQWDNIDIDWADK